MATMRQAHRALRRSPGLTLAALLSLSLGIGATSAIYTVIQALLLRPLPYADADRLVILWNRSPGLNIEEDWFSTAQYFDIRTRHTGLEDVAIALGANANLTGEGRPERVGTIRVSSNLLPLLGAQPLHGRLFEPADDQPGTTPAAILGYDLWVRRYAADPAIVGRPLLINGNTFTVVGILPSNFSLPREVLPTLGVVDDGDVFLPLPLGADAAQVRTREDYNLIGRLRPGVDLGAAQVEMDGLTARLRAEHPDVYPPNGGLTFSLVPLQEQVVGDVRLPLWILGGAVACVLLIACANVANLLLARALDRRRELAVRVALGATRGQIVRQALAESVVLALAGGAGGILLALDALRWLHTVRPPSVPRLDAITLDPWALAFTAGLSLLVGTLVGLLPALRSGHGLQDTLRDGARGVSHAGSLWSRGHGTRRLLLVGQLALSVWLLISAGLLIRSFAHLQTVSPGFTPQGVLTMELTLTGPKYPGAPEIRNAYKTLFDELSTLPGVEAAGGVTSLPFSNFFAWGPITIEGRTPPPGEKFINADQRTVAGRYFEALQIPLKQGRFFAPSDTPDQPRVVIIDERLAREYFGDANPIGRRLKFGDAASESPWETIVGVVGRVSQYGLDADSRIALYRPITQSGARSLFVVTRTSRDLDAVAVDVRSTVQRLDPDVPVYRMMSMDTRVARSLERRRFLMWLLSLFAGLALVLAAVGVGGVMAYLVRQGTRDLGIRLALGASPAGIQRLVLWHAGAVAGLGAVIGVLAAGVSARLIDDLLYGVHALDPITLTIGALTLFVVALVAVWAPARRASKIDPLIALRAE